jgi:hypothetical protein
VNGFSALERTKGTETTISHIRDLEIQRSTKLDDLSVLGELCADIAPVDSNPSVPLSSYPPPPNGEFATELSRRRDTFPRPNRIGSR